MSSAKPRAKAGSREQWSSQWGFLVAAVGSAVGLGNIWRFPNVAYENGGGAFMIPYLIALLTAGIPILFLDYALGHRYRGSTPAVFRRISKKFEFLGWWQILVCFVIMTYYAVIIAWALRYVFYSVDTSWNNGNRTAETFFFNDFINLSETPGFSPSPVWNVFLPLAAIWLFVMFIIGRGVAKGVERANKIFLPLLVVLFLALVVRALMLPGAVDGLNTLWTPDFEALTSRNVWIQAYAQVFYSLSVAFGIMLTYSSYLRRRSNLVGTGTTAAFANSSFELLAGFGVFATLGFLAHQQGTSVGELEGISGIALSFVTFPTVISQMPGGALFGVLFFLSLTLAGITSLISLVQVVAAGISEKFATSPLRASMLVCVPAATISLLVFGTSGGLHSLDVVDEYINSIGVVLSAIIMCVLVALVGRRLPELQRHLNVVSQVRVVGTWWRVLVGIVVPLMLTYMFVDSVFHKVVNQYDSDSYSRVFESVFGWGAVAVAVIGTIIMTRIPWDSSVDKFVPLDLDEYERKESK
ncbi:MAG: sodium-dependent transporter [Actinomycetaceae bacterium]|nr:sodium-dependent transporter [Actinomycetaceae bacterium]